jgi:hypothetical protein
VLRTITLLIILVTSVSSYAEETIDISLTTFSEQYVRGCSIDVKNEELKIIKRDRNLGGIGTSEKKDIFRTEIISSLVSKLLPDKNFAFQGWALRDKAFNIKHPNVKVIYVKTSNSDKDIPLKVSGVDGLNYTSTSPEGMQLISIIETLCK